MARTVYGPVICWVRWITIRPDCRPGSPPSYCSRRSRSESAVHYTINIISFYLHQTKSFWPAKLESFETESIDFEGIKCQIYYALSFTVRNETRRSRKSWCYSGNQTAPKFRRKMCDFKCELNAKVRMSDGRVFQIVGAGTDNLCPPSVSDRETSYFILVRWSYSVHWCALVNIHLQGVIIVLAVDAEVHCSTVLILILRKLADPGCL